MFEFLALLSLGFVVGLSGAVIPGPLLAFTIFDTSRKRRVTGHHIIMGHALWEAVVILIILLGFGGLIMQNRMFIYVAGGIVLILMGITMIRGKGGEVRVKASKINSSLLGGVFYTAFNPTQPPWWATAGLALLLRGLELMGSAGIVVVTMGHWLSDFTYYLFVSLMIHKHERYVVARQKAISTLLGLFMTLLSAYFITHGLMGGTGPL